MDEENEKCYTPQNDGASGVDYSPTAQSVKQKKKERKKHPGLRAAVLILVCILLGAAAGIGGTVFMHRYYVNHSDLSENARRVAALVEGSRKDALSSAAVVDTDKLLTPAQVYAASVSSTVGIRTSVTAVNFWGYSSTSAASARSDFSWCGNRQAKVFKF